MFFRSRLISNFVSATCIDSNSHVNKLKGTSSKHVDGWNIHLDTIISQHDDEYDLYEDCKDLGGPNDFWAGCCDGKTISTNLYGCGHAKLNVGNCWRAYTVTVFLDGTQLGTIPSNTNSKIFEFPFNEGSVLKIDSGDGIIKFNNFEVTDCNCGN